MMPDADGGAAGVELPLIAYYLNKAGEMPIVPASGNRAWMDNTKHRFAHRCLPLLISNQAGWFLLSNHKVAVTWGGSARVDDLRVEHLEGDEPFAARSHFGHGILTFTLPYLFRSPPGYDLLLRGPTNMPKDGIASLEGIVETDWATATATMNWKMTRPGHTVTFEIGEPIAMIVPMPRGDLERFRPEIRHVSADRQTQQEYHLWWESREDFNRQLRIGGPAGKESAWQKHYMRGQTITGRRPAPDHRSSLKLADFVDRRAVASAPDTAPNEAANEPVAPIKETPIRSLVMLSGGIDSVYCLLKLLRETTDIVYAHHIHLINFTQRHDVETERCRRIVEWCETNIRPLHYSESVIDRSNLRNIGADMMAVAHQVGIVARNFALDRWIVGTCSEEGHWIERHKHVEALVAAACHPTPPPQHYQFPPVPKADEMAYLPPEILEMTWGCRRPQKTVDGYSECGACKTCVTIATARRQLDQSDSRRHVEA